MDLQNKYRYRSSCQETFRVSYFIYLKLEIGSIDRKERIEFLMKKYEKPFQ